MRKSFSFLLFNMLSLAVMAQPVHELSLHFRNGVLINRPAVTTTGDNIPIANVSNTFHQSIGFTYGIPVTDKIQVTGGADLGYEHYKVFVDFPFEAYGYMRNPTLSTQYRHYAYIPYTQLTLQAGYKAAAIGRWQPEIRLGPVLHLPLRQQAVDAFSTERPLNGHRGDNFTLNGWYGKPVAGKLTTELLGALYIGAGIPGLFENVSRLNIGLQVQTRLYQGVHHHYFEASYYDESGIKRSSEIFDGKHTSINIILGLTLSNSSKSSYPDDQEETE